MVSSVSGDTEYEPTGSSPVISSEITGMIQKGAAQIINNANFCKTNNFPRLLNGII